ncbi:hypothetical protein PCIT_a3039 [Pseudoalteromonas citrea]|uniref:Viral coat protein P2 N-terminal domain-containing protein n=2 Tax=Pseudoalteromonas citrea TaxID=43655 RepID=A0AAD4AI82_9GAMM|nr:major capsid protein P2 [Pseudoalteromonas citrea]KAF7770084.1 hypothetical protein PCIT_a3039 [Pseudoalteromonas citrea]
MNISRPSRTQLPSPTGTDYNEEWNIKLQAGVTYHSIELETNLKNVKTIKKITIDIGGVPVVTRTNEILDLMDSFYKRYKQTGRFVVDLSKFDYRTPAGIYQTQLVTVLNDDVTLKIEFGSRGTNDPERPTLKAKAYVTDTDNYGRIFKPTMYDLTQISGAAGDHTWQMPNTGANRFVQRILFDESEVKIAQIKVKRGSQTIETITRADLDYALQRVANVELQDGYCLLDFTLFGFGSDGSVPTLGLGFELQVDSNGAIKTYIEGYDQVKRIPVAGD